MLDFLAVLACSFLGFSLIALTQDQHRKRVAAGAVRQPTMPRRLQRAAGAAMLAIALGVSLSLEGGDFASLLWVFSISLGAQLVAVVLTWAPGLFRPLLGGGGVEL